MAYGLGARFLAFLVVSGAASAAVWGAFEYTAAPTVARGVAVTLFESSLNASAGHVVAYPVLVENRASETRMITLTLLPGPPGTAPTTSMTLPPGASRATWVPITLASTAAPGTYRVEFSARTSGSVGDIYVGAGTLRVLPPAAGAQLGDMVTVRFVGLLENRTTFDGSLPFSAHPAFPLYASFAPRAAPFTFALGDPTEPIRGASARMIGMEAGEAREIRVPPGEAFGEAVIENAFPRAQTFPINLSVSAAASNATRREVAAFMTSTNQGPFTALRPGDTFFWRVLAGQQPVFIRVRLATSASTDDGIVTWEWPGPTERFTIFSAFPSASFFAERDGPSWTIRTEPTYVPGEAFTYASYWPLGSRITGCTPDCPAGSYATTETVSITHLDAAWNGTSFVYTGQTPVNYRVKSIDPQRIIVTAANPHPFAGQTISWEIRLLSVARP